MFRFESPLFLFLLPLVFFLWRSRNSIPLSSIDIIPKVQSLKSGLFPLKLMQGLLFTVFILSLSRPQLGDEQKRTNETGRDLVILVDTSGSMKALDFKIDGENIDRLSVVKKVLRDFVNKRKGDRISLISFGDYPVTLSPLTLDTSSLGETIDQLEIGMAGESTAIGSALGLGVKRIKNIKAEEKIIILMTDGRNNSGDVSPEQMSTVAKELGIRIYTIGLGRTNGEAPFLVNGFFGKKVVYRNVDLDDETLKKISRTSGGKYFNALDTKALEEVYQDIDKLEKRESEMFSHVNYRDLYPYLLAFLALLVLLEAGMRVTRWRVFP